MAWERVIIQDGEETIARDDVSADGLVTERQARDWLDIKAASHSEKGWTVTRIGDELHITKVYIEGPVTAKARRLFIRQVT